MKIFLATNNNNKKIEIKSIFCSISNEFEIVDDYFTDIEETSDTLEGNALLKAEHGYKQSGIPTISGKIEGQISKAPLGNNGFGYDPIFVFNGRTLAQMDSSEKNEISHRKSAFMKIAKALLR